MTHLMKPSRRVKGRHHFGGCGQSFSILGWHGTVSDRGREHSEVWVLRQRDLAKEGNLKVSLKTCLRCHHGRGTSGRICDERQKFSPNQDCLSLLQSVSSFTLIFTLFLV